MHTPRTQSLAGTESTFLALALLLLLSCKAAPEEQAAETPSCKTQSCDEGTKGTAYDEDASSTDLPSYRGIAPLLRAHCVTCHQQGGIAPFALTSYELAVKHAKEIVEATRERRMPPMPVNNDGTCNTYRNARWLTDDEIELLAAWVLGGQHEGKPLADLEAERLPALQEPDVVLDMGEEYQPSAGDTHDDYRCFVLPSPVAKREFLREYQVLPGNAESVHHVIVFQPSTAAAVEAAHELDAADPGPGYTCFGSSQIDASPFALWAPGGSAIQLPEGTGVPLAPNRDLVMQVHYNLESGSGPDRTRVALRFADEPVITAQYWPVFNLEFRAPPGRELVTSSASSSMEPTNLTVHGVLPHMHLLGRTLRVEAEVAGETRCLADVDRWDFHWQNAWWYDAPLKLEDVTGLSIRCGFDTRSRNDVVTWGDGTMDEMCINYLYVTTDEEPEPQIDCDSPDNPVFGSCLDQLVTSCYAPDITGECTDDGTMLRWEEGFSLLRDEVGLSLFTQNTQDACLAITLANPILVSSINAETSADAGRSAQQIALASSDAGYDVQCADGSHFSASDAEVHEFSVCRGLECPQ